MRRFAPLAVLALLAVSVPPSTEARAPRERCALRRVTSVIEGEDGTFTLVASLRNESTTERSILVRGVCPGGVARFTGLPREYDVYGTCAMGPCAAPPGASAVTIAPGHSVELARATIDPRDSSCNRPLPPGRYRIAFDIDVTGEATCAGPRAPLVVRSRPAPPEQTRRHGRCPPMPACGIGCPGAMAHDANGCTMCACEPGPLPP